MPELGARGSVEAAPSLVEDLYLKVVMIDLEEHIDSDDPGHIRIEMMHLEDSNFRRLRVYMDLMYSAGETSKFWFNGRPVQVQRPHSRSGCGENSVIKAPVRQSLDKRIQNSYSLSGAVPDAERFSPQRPEVDVFISTTRKKSQSVSITSDR